MQTKTCHPRGQVSLTLACTLKEKGRDTGLLQLQTPEKTKCCCTGKRIQLLQCLNAFALKECKCLDCAQITYRNPSFYPQVSQGTTQVPCTVTFTPFALWWQHGPSEALGKAFCPHFFNQMQFYHYSGQDFLSECNIKGRSDHSSQCDFSVLVRVNRSHLFPSPLTLSFHTVVFPISQFNYFLL